MYPIIEAFINPSSGFRSAPLWVWNDDMKKGNIKIQLKELKEHGFGGAFIHPRPGLVTEYLSDAWFELWAYALDVAGKLELKLYIYDENSYPSGFAGGHIPSQLPDCLASAVLMKKRTKHDLVNDTKEASLTDLIFNKPGHPICAFAYDGKATLIKNLTYIPISEWQQYGDYYLIYELGIPETNAWLGGFALTDLMRPEVTELFLKTTYEAYSTRFGDHFGTLIPAIFTDEPEISPGNLFEDGGHFLPFSYWFAGEFEARNGYDLKDYLPCLFMDVKGDGLSVDYRKVRYDYYRTIHELWVNNSVRPISEWCSEKGIAYTGHYLEHNWPYPFGRVSPSVMSMYEYMHWPAIDMLMTNLLRKDGTEPLEMLCIKEVKSVANQFDREKVVCEAYGAGGWDSTFEDYKRIGDWLMVHGITFVNQHLTYSTIAGARKRDHPQSFDWRQPWWEEYTQLNDYQARLSYMLSLGETHNRLLVLNPTTSTFLLAPDAANARLAPDCQEKVQYALEMFQFLSDQQWDYDLGDEFIIEGHGSIEAGKFKVAQRTYEVVIIPGMMTHMFRSTVDKLRQFLQEGGYVVALGQPGSYVEGDISDEIIELSKHEHWSIVTNLQQLDHTIRQHMQPNLEWESELPQGVTYLKRVYNDESIGYFIVNSSSEEVSSVLSITGAHVELWDPWSGKKASVHYKSSDGKLYIPLKLPSIGSLLLKVYKTASENKEIGKPQKHNSTSVVEQGMLTITAEVDNTLVLDYCDLAVRSKSYKDIHVLHGGRLIYEQHGFEINPWDNAIQFKRRLLDREGKFSGNSGFEAAYTFYIREGEIPASLRMVLERPEYYRIAVNGVQVEMLEGSSTMDHHMGETEISHILCSGENRIVITAHPFSIFLELEAIYLKGSFGVFADEKRWIIGKKPDLTVGAWTTQGYPFYEGAVIYERSLILEDQLENICLVIPNVECSAISVWVNGENAGLVGVWNRNQINISQWLHSGVNKVKVRVCGSFKNFLGPHHDKAQPRRQAWPGMWKVAPKFGQPLPVQYDLIHYGLIEDWYLV